MFLRVLTALAMLVTFGFADTLTLRTGEVVRGQYVGGDARHLRMAIGDQVQTYAIDDVASLQFGGESRSEARSEGAPRDMGVREPPPAAPSGTMIPTGTTITVRMIDGVNSEQSRMGQTYRASVDEPVLLDGQTVIPRGADAITKLVEDKESGKIEGRTVLTLVLQQVMANGRTIDLTTGDV